MDRKPDLLTKSETLFNPLHTDNVDDDIILPLHNIVIKLTLHNKKPFCLPDTCIILHMVPRNFPHFPEFFCRFSTFSRKS